MFGRKKPEQVGRPQSSSSDASGGGPTNASTPWASWPDFIGCNLAFAHLVGNLELAITVDGRVHAETLIAAAGAVAGWGAQCSLFSKPQTPSEPANGEFMVIKTNDGREFLFGNAINGMLMSNDPVLAQRCVWNLLAGAAVGRGMPQHELEGVHGMFSHVTKTLGGPGEGFPSTAKDHQPGTAVGPLLDHVRPLALACMTGAISKIAKEKGFKAEPSSWQAVTARAAAVTLSKCCSVLSPTVALTIGMESAIYASKILKNRATAAPA